MLFKGTTTNGSFLLSFRRGAFTPISPIKIVCLHYNFSKFHLCLTSIDDYYCYIFAFLFYRLHLTVYIFDDFFPDYLNLDPNKESDILIY